MPVLERWTPFREFDLLDQRMRRLFSGFGRILYRLIKPQVYGRGPTRRPFIPRSTLDAGFPHNYRQFRQRRFGGRSGLLGVFGVELEVGLLDKLVELAVRRSEVDVPMPRGVA
jgi:hypothetical protein